MVPSPEAGEIAEFQLLPQSPEVSSTGFGSGATERTDLVLQTLNIGYAAKQPERSKALSAKSFP